MTTRTPFITVNIEGPLGEVKEQVASLANSIGLTTTADLAGVRRLTMQEVSSIFHALGVSREGVTGLNKINAIKQARALFGCGLVEAKNLVEGTL